MPEPLISLPISSTISKSASRKGSRGSHWRAFTNSCSSRLMKSLGSTASTSAVSS